MNTQSIKVEVWSDFVCPFCYIGKRRYENALAQFEHKDKVELVFRSFQLNPNEKKTRNADNYSRLMAKYGITIEKAKSMCDHVVKQAKSVGLDFDFTAMIVTNTFDAHRLSQFAKKYNKGNEIAERILKAYYAESKDIADFETLTQLAVEVGLDEKETRSILSDGKYGEEVKKDIKEASERDVHGVPYFLINNKHVVSGAQPENVFLNALREVWEEENKETKRQDNYGEETTEFGDGACTNGVCKI